MCSRIVRHSLKEPHRALAIKRGEQGLKAARWAQGKQGEVSKRVLREREEEAPLISDLLEPVEVIDKKD